MNLFSLIIVTYGASHTVWGSMADEESMNLALQLVQGKSSSKPGTMRMLDEPVQFTMTPTTDSATALNTRVPYQK